jgi:ABC-type dipeptide/oligopeptide/nickel transport system ATPase subunit
LRQVHAGAHARGAGAADIEGRIEIEGRALDRADPAAFGRLIQYVFQDPISSLNPRKTIRQIIEAPLKRLHGLWAGPARAADRRDFRQR